MDASDEAIRDALCFGLWDLVLPNEEYDIGACVLAQDALSKATNFSSVGVCPSGFCLGGLS